MELILEFAYLMKKNSVFIKMLNKQRLIQLHLFF